MFPTKQKQTNKQIPETSTSSTYHEKKSNLHNTFLYTTFFSTDSKCNNHILFTNKTDMLNNINHNNLIPLSILPRYNNNNIIKLAKSIIPTPAPIIQQIIPIISSSHHKISTLSQKNCKQQP